jgi:hypothetical protein
MRRVRSRMCARAVDGWSDSGATVSNDGIGSAPEGDERTCHDGSLWALMRSVYSGERNKEKLTLLRKG